MRLIIHDLMQNEFDELFPVLKPDDRVIGDDGTIKSCIGCFGCWVKTPGQCVIRDEYQRMGELLAGSDEVVMISRCYFGSYSPFVKNVLDRSISFILPYFTRVNGEMHHQRRYQKSPYLTVCFYGADIMEREMATARKLVKAEAVNLHVSDYSTQFYKAAGELKGVFV